MLKNCQTCKWNLIDPGQLPCRFCQGDSDNRLRHWEAGLTIESLIEISHLNAKNKGFWDKPREFGTVIALIHSELSEALEADRHNEKEHVAEELADVAIRLGDLCGGLEIDLESAILEKMEKNAARPRLHGKNY